MAFQVTEVQKALQGAHYSMDGSRLSQAGQAPTDGPNAVTESRRPRLG